MAARTLSEWEICYESWDPAEQPLREALTVLGNGRFATRGAGEETSAGGPHYPGTYLAGGYDRLESRVSGRTVENEDLVNWPNWLPLSFRRGGGEWFDLGSVEVLEYEQRLDLFRGILMRHVRFRDVGGHEFELDTRRLVHMADPHLAAIDWVLTPITWSGQLEIRSGIDGRVSNAGVARYRALDGNHIEVLDAGAVDADSVFLLARTRQSQIAMAQAVRTRIGRAGVPATVERRTETSDGWVGQDLILACEPHVPIRVEKVLASYSSLDFAISEPRVEACTRIGRAAGFDTLLESHEIAWKHLWHRADLVLVDRERERYSQAVLRLHVFHMLQTASINSIGRDVGVPARGLHGEAYRGHIFWDELFIFPFLNLRIPEVTRALLLYRYRRLHEARCAAKAEGYAGAMFPWQSGSNGREETQVLHLNPRSGRWIPDNTHRQRHVNAAIAYNIWQYHQATNDLEFLAFYGAEMLLELARFWASIASFDPDRQRYSVKGVVGPDEFHTQYPGTDSLGLDDNAYTNIMAAWVLRTARAAFELLTEDRRAELREALRISTEELGLWDQVSRRLYVPFHGNRIISQFEGWDQLEELDWDALRQRHGDIKRLDRALEAEGDDPNRYRAAKQADVLMLFFLFSAEELEDIFRHLGYEYDRELIPRNIDYYLGRTSHGSTLSHVVHAWVLARRDRPRSWQLFRDALASDIDDVQGGTTAEGVHLGAMAGTVDLVQRCYTGVEMRRGVLWLNPRLPDELSELTLSLRYHGHWLGIHITHEKMTVSFERGWSEIARIGFKGEVFEMDQGQELSFDLDSSDEGTVTS